MRELTRLEKSQISGLINRINRVSGYIKEDLSNQEVDDQCVNRLVELTAKLKDLTTKL